LHRPYASKDPSTDGTFTVHNDITVELFVRSDVTWQETEGFTVATVLDTELTVSWNCEVEEKNVGVTRKRRSDGGMARRHSW
jgi:hypothetical protein